MKSAIYTCMKCGTRSSALERCIRCGSSNGFEMKKPIQVARIVGLDGKVLWESEGTVS